MINVTSSPAEIVGDLVITAGDVERLETLAEAECLENPPLVNGNATAIKNLQVGQTARLRLYPQRLSDSQYFETVDELLRLSSQEYPTKRFYVFDLDFDSAGAVTNELITKFRFATKLITYLRGISDYQKERELVFFQAKSLILKTDYTREDLGDLSKVDDLIAHITNSADSEERKIIFVNELIAALAGIAVRTERFPHLLSHFDDIFANYKKSHGLYLEQYSFQKIKSEIDKEIFDYSKQVQGVINDAQTKLVTIPAAYLVIVSQFDLSGQKLYFNLALLLSSIVFGILLDVLIRNQNSALTFISGAVSRFQTTIDGKKVSVLGDDFNASFDTLNEQINRQRCYLRIIRTLIWLTPIFALGLFILSLIGNTATCWWYALFGPGCDRNFS